ncbi:MAG: tRNA (adenosine(37)-N6)-threonylcarbamoyltransferase complex dimerization subunit type 1 TsaB [Verrucomicrobiota bacterium]
MHVTDRLVLALDLSTSRGALAVVRGVEVLYESAFQSERSHNAQVFAPLAEALAAIPLGESAALVIGTGPGSYTGVRISIAAAQGVALSRGWPVLGWPSIATSVLGTYSVLGDARRGQYYHATVEFGRMVQAPRLMTAEEAASLVGSGGTWLTFDAKAPLGLEGITGAQPDVVSLGRIVSQLPENELQSRAAESLEPFYLQEAFITVARKAGKQVPSA